MNRHGMTGTKVARSGTEEDNRIRYRIANQAPAWTSGKDQTDLLQSS